MPTALSQAKFPNTGTGPYLRVWSSSPASAMSAQVYLPSVASGAIAYAAGTKDDAFVYSGGWGNNGEAVDAGFEHETGSDTWGVFIKYQANPEYFGIDQPRLSGNQTVSFAFWVPADGTLHIEATGQAVTVLGTVKDLGPNNVVALGVKTIVVELSNADGFTADGVDMILKRMTSIGQKPESLTNSSKIENVAWSNVQLGTDPTNLTPWEIPADSTHDYNDTVVTVNYTNGQTETVSIDLI